MALINLTPHSISVFPEAAFVNLEQTNPTTWAADAVDSEKLIASFESEGIARIGVEVKEAGDINGIPLVETKYGEIEGVPKAVGMGNCYLIVSLPTASMARQSGKSGIRLAGMMVSPYKVVRLRSNPSQVLGCMGFTRQ